MRVPVLSVCVPCYERPELLRRALDSLHAAAQGRERDIELVISDDSRDDRCRAVAETSVAAWRGPALYRRNPVRLGMAANWNRALFMGSGGLRLLLHDDDYLLPGGLPRALAFIDRYPQESCFLLGVYVVDLERAVRRRQVPRRERYLDPAAALRKLCANSSFVRVPGVILRGHVLDEVGGFDTVLDEPADLDMWLRTFGRYGVRVLPVPLAAYTVHEGALTAGMFTARTLETVWELIRRQVPPELVQPAEREALLSHWTHQFVLAGVVRALRRGDRRAAKAVFGLLDHQEVRQLPASRRWLVPRLILRAALAGSSRRSAVAPASQEGDDLGAGPTGRHKADGLAGPCGASEAAMKVLRRVARLPLLRLVFLRPRMRAAIGQVTALRFLRSARLVQRPGQFLLRELFQRGSVAAYQLHGHDNLVLVRHGLPDVATFDEVFYQRIYDPPIFCRRWLEERSGRLRIVDLGANLGFFAIYATIRYPGAELIAVEPDPVNMSILRRQVEANSLDAKVIEACAATSAGHVPFASGLGPGSHVLSEAQGDAIMVRAVDVFPLLHQADFIKMDIEGAEWEILADPRLAELQEHVLALEFHPRGTPAASAAGRAVSVLRMAGYETALEHVGLDGAGMVWALKLGPSPVPKPPGHIEDAVRTPQRIAGGRDPQ